MRYAVSRNPRVAKPVIAPYADEEEDNEDEERFLDMDDRRTCEVEIRSPLKDGRMQDEETQKDEGGDDDDEEEA